LNSRFSGLKQLREASLCPNGCYLWSYERLPPGSAPAGSLVWCTEQLWESQEAPEQSFLAGVALTLLSWKMGAALGLAGRCRGSTQLGKATIARFQAWHGSPRMGQNRCTC